MRNTFLLICMICMSAVFTGCQTIVEPDDSAITGLFDTSSHGWQGDASYKIIKKLPSRIVHNGIGVIQEDSHFEDLWDAYSIERPLPKPSIDFSKYVVLFIYDPEFYNYCKIMKISVDRGIAKPIFVRMRSKLSIESMVFVSMVTLPREGIRAICTADNKYFPID